ncbi:MAG: hypothetical protein ACAF41_15295 [Leptolyngbya sp. BL-A-14]
MVSRNAVKGVLHNFLETYTSRYSDYDGYWLFGLLIEGLEQLDIDLLKPQREVCRNAINSAAMQLATAKFKDQVEKGRLDLASFQQASLVITKSLASKDGYVNCHKSAGFEISFVIRATLHEDKTYECRKAIFVAPHNPKVERRSGRAN